MDLSADVAAILPEFRARAESLMTETVTVGLYEDAVDPDTLENVRTLVTEHYTGPASVKYPTLTVSERDAAGQPFGAQDIVVKIPLAAPHLPEGDIIRVTASTADLHLVDRQFRIKGSPQSGQVTSHRYPVEELT